ncbi:MAG TPA: Glu/Leu/Phe/Val dehydrogenase dimerization domain-containing protein [Longimicrobiales bacterium]|nr:Glu/Leu/Phe/Val dehydrogenase dimerization domain-containing protein [Longimicrobiales bacterium]
MDLKDALSSHGVEQVTLCRDVSTGYVGIIAVHSTVLGPAVGGTRVWAYDSLDDAFTDALRLSRGMTYKNALAGLPFGGGKAVILGPAPGPGPARDAFFRAHGRYVDRMGGMFITGEDVGTSPDDMESIAQETDFVAGRVRGMGDPSPFTALGVRRAMEAVAAETWGSDDLAGKKVAIQGLGNVGGNLAAELYEAGARLVVCDPDQERVASAVTLYRAEPVSVDAILDAEADIFAPCAMGGVLDDDAVGRLRVAAVCGGANNQLLRSEHGERLRERGVRYVPDYVANAGGVISGSVDIAGWDMDRMSEALDQIYHTVREVFALASNLGVGTHVAADRMAEARLAAAQHRWGGGAEA